MKYNINENVKIGDTIRIEKPTKLKPEDFTIESTQKLINMVFIGNSPEVKFLDNIETGASKDRDGIIGVTPSGKRYNLQALKDILWARKIFKKL